MNIKVVAFTVSEKSINIVVYEGSCQNLDMVPLDACACSFMSLHTRKFVMLLLSFADIF